MFYRRGSFFVSAVALVFYSSKTNAAQWARVFAPRPLTDAWKAKDMVTNIDGTTVVGGIFHANRTCLIFTAPSFLSPR